MPTNAIFGFVRDIMNIRRQKKPDYLLVAFDTGEDTFRHAISTDYKANRSEMPDNLRPQIPLIRHVLEAFRIPTLAQAGLEADDFLASVAVSAAKRKIHAYLCTSDKDVRQVVGPMISIADLRKNRVLDEEFIKTDWGIRPDQVVDYQAMVGDSVDNIKGIPGVGPKTASKLLQQFETLEGIFAHVDEIPQQKLRENLKANREVALKCRELVKLKTDIPLPDDWSAWKVQQPDYAKVEEIFLTLGFHRPLDEIRAEATRAGVKYAPAKKIVPKAKNAKPDEGSLFDQDFMGEGGDGDSGVSSPATLDDLLYPNAPDWVTDYRAVTTPSEFEAFFAELSQQKRFSLDLETTDVLAVAAEIVGYAICWEDGKGYYIAVRAPKGQTSLEPDTVLETLRPILESKSIEKVGQNLKYDMIVLRSAGVDLQGVAFDSMVGSYLLEPGERVHGLDDLAMRYLRHDTIKIESLIGTTKLGGIKRMDQVTVEKIRDYACEDADVAWRLTQLLEPRIRKTPLGKLNDELEIPLIRVLADMEFQGIRVDADHLAQLGQEFGDRLEIIKQEAFDLAGEEFNLDSPTQLREILFTKLKLPVIKRTPSGPSTDQEVLEELSDRHPLCAKLIEHRTLAKLKGTYVDALPMMICAKTGRIHCSFHQTVAATGRLSSSEPNLQNIPVQNGDGERIRQAFIAGDESKVLLSADYSQIELRLLAHFSQDPTLLKAFADDLDIHAAVAASIAGIEPHQVTSDQRRSAKAVNFGIMYGLSAFGLAKQLGITKDEGAKFIDAYYERYQAIDQFFTSVLTETRELGFVETMLGRRRLINGIRRFPNRVRNLPERTAINTKIQGSAADLIKQAMIDLHRWIETNRAPARMLLQIHDELVFEVPKDEVDEFAKIVRKLMESALKLNGVELKVDVSVGRNWLEMDEVAETK